jgi:hypothetical protein
MKKENKETDKTEELILKNHCNAMDAIMDAMFSKPETKDENNIKK